MTLLLFRMSLFSKKNPKISMIDNLSSGVESKEGRHLS